MRRTGHLQYVILLLQILLVYVHAFMERNPSSSSVITSHRSSSYTSTSTSSSVAVSSPFCHHPASINKRASSRQYARPPWQRSRGKKGEDETDQFWLLEQSLLGLSSVASEAEEEIEEEDDDDELVGRPAEEEGGADITEVLIVEEHEAKMRADRFLAKRLKDQSRSALGDLLESGIVAINGARARKSLKVSAGDKVEVRIRASSAQIDLEPEDIPLDILYEDEHIIAVCKGPGMVVHPAPGNRNGTFVNALLYHLAKQSVTIEANAGAEGRPGIVHRLDKGTSGVLIAAKTAQSHAALSAAFSERRVNKTYLAVVIGNPGPEAVIGRHPKDRQRMSVAMTTLGDSPSMDEEEILMAAGSRGILSGPLIGRAAKSIVRTLAFDGRLSVVQVEIETGRTHQIRVHLQHRRHPVVGDELYGNAQWNGRGTRRWGIDRPMLHALRLEVEHPVTGKMLKLVAPVPEDMMNVVRGVWPKCMEVGREGEVPWWEGGVPDAGREEGEKVVVMEEEEEEEENGVDPFWR